MRRLKTAVMVICVLILLGTASVGAIWAITSNANAAEVVAATPTPLVLPPRDNMPIDEVIVAQEVYVETQEESLGISIDYSDIPWNLTLVNRYNILPEDFTVYTAEASNGHYFDARAVDSLVAMLNSARAEGLSPLVVSGHRSIARQTTLFNNQLNRQLDLGYDEETAFDNARRVVAYPGESEHNLGLAVDIVSNNHLGLTASFSETPEGMWLAENSHRYGFVLRYPYHKQDITHIIYEPWHFRYVGVPHATTMFEMDLVLEEYIEMLILNDE
ncbi:MAG: M15 family metallopeptidase [Defluviitaleaceae bacterium]|nr:M15 family metallopeptidase [Defluviitaleaceae bacterium]